MNPFYSLRWKLGLTFCLISFAIVTIYVTMATQIFESDKLSYVVDFNQLQTEALAERMDDYFEQAVFEIKSLWSAYDKQTRKLSTLGEKFLEKNSHLIGFGVNFYNKPDSNIYIHKTQVSDEILKILEQNQAEFDEMKFKDGVYVEKVEVPDRLIFKIVIAMGLMSSPNFHTIKFLVDFTKKIPTQFGQGLLLLTKANKIYTTVGESELLENEILNFLKSTENESTDRSNFHKLGNKDYLVSTVQLKTGGLKFVYFEEKAIILGALKVLLNRSVIFMVMSFFAIIFISIFSSGALTKNLSILTAAAVEVAKGNLEHKVKIKSKDEIGILAKTFQHMIDEIKNLLLQKEEKVRMEQELKTASWVQESLFPIVRNFEYGTLSFAGDHMPSTECSGDWWHYFQRDNDLFIIIGDATGHGTSAALITAASRAVFAHLENTNYSLSEMAESWNKAIIKCSLQKLYMTAQLLQINSLTGEFQILNLSHEPPFRINSSITFDEGKTIPSQGLGSNKVSSIEIESENLNTLPPLGREINLNLKMDQGCLEPGSMLMLYTDGLFSVVNKDGKPLSDKEFLRRLKKSVSMPLKAREVLNSALKVATDFNSGNIIDDDIAILIIERKDVKDMWNAA